VTTWHSHDAHVVKARKNRLGICEMKKYGKTASKVVILDSVWVKYRVDELFNEDWSMLIELLLYESASSNRVADGFTASQVRDVPGLPWGYREGLKGWRVGDTSINQLTQNWFSDIKTCYKPCIYLTENITVNTNWKFGP